MATIRFQTLNTLHLLFDIKNITMSHVVRITTDFELCHGKPCIRGMRWPVEIIIDLLGSGMTIEQILEDHQD
jgi:uncharacterized protein (DUF433 family)